MKKIICLVILLSFHSVVFSQTNEHFENANTSFNEDRLDDAYIHLKNSLQAYPEHLPSKILMGTVLALSYYYEDAQLELEEALSAGGDPNLIIEFLANTLIFQEKYEEALLLTAVGLTKKNTALLFAIQARANAILGNLEKAHRLYQRSINLDNTNASLFRAFAEFQLTQDQITKAATNLDMALALEDSNSETYRLLAKVSLKQGEQQHYRANLQHALSIDIDQPLVLRDLVSSYIATGEFNEAKETLERALAISPNDSMGQLLYSFVTARLGQGKLSKSTLDTLVNNLSLIDESIMRDASGLVYISAMANFASGNLEVARQNFQKYLFNNPSDLNAALMLVDVYVTENNLTSAVNVLEDFKDAAAEDIQLGSRLCDLYIRTNINHKCVWLLNKLVTKFSEHPLYISTNARSLAARGKVTEALYVLNNAVGTEFNLDKVLLSIQANDLDSAKKHLNKLLKEQPENPDLMNVLASIAIKEGDIAQAKDMLEILLAKSPNHFSANFNLASTYYNSRQFEAALRIGNDLLVKQPRNLSVMLLVGRSLVGLERFEQALLQLGDLLTIDKNNISAKLALIDIYYEQKKYDDAISILDTLVKQNFLEPKFLAKRVFVNIAKNDNIAAADDLKTLQSIYANDVVGLLEVSQLQQQINDYVNAIASIDMALKISPDGFPILREKIRLALIVGKLEKNDTHLERLISLYPNEADTYLLQGDLAQANREYGTAASFYSKAIAKNNNYIQALAKRYQLALGGIDTHSFEKQFEAIVKKEDSILLTRHLLADYYLEAKNPNKAKDHYLHLAKAKRYETMSRVLNNLANIYLEEGNINTAQEFAQRAYNLDNTDQSVLSTLGWSHTLADEYEQGLDYLRRAYVMNSAEPSVRFYIGYTLNKLGRKKEAITELNHLIKQFDNSDYTERAKALLSEI